MMAQTNKDTVYLDYASSTPVRDEVREAMEPFWSEHFANPQSNHSYGKRVQSAVDNARDIIADVLSVQSSELVFTSGATEANALAVTGYVKAQEAGDKKLITTQTAHNSQKYADEQLKAEKELLVGSNGGRLQSQQVVSSVSSKKDLVSVPYVNSEIGTVQPIREISADMKKAEIEAPLHIDASQAGLYLSIRPEDTGADMMTVNGHKLYGPKGIGLLWIRSGAPMKSLLPTNKNTVVGDYQTLRPGTPPVPLIVGFANALKWAQEGFRTRAKEVSQVRDFALKKLQDEFSEMIINGNTKHRIANNINISFPDTNHDFLATKLDKEGVIVSTASACQSSTSGSEVITALPNSVESALRITLGKKADKSAIRQLVAALHKVL